MEGNIYGVSLFNFIILLAMAFQQFPIKCVWFVHLKAFCISIMLGKNGFGAINLSKLPRYIFYVHPFLTHWPFAPYKCIHSSLFLWVFDLGNC